MRRAPAEQRTHVRAQMAMRGNEGEGYGEDWGNMRAMRARGGMRAKGRRGRMGAWARRSMGGGRKREEQKVS